MNNRISLSTLLLVALVAWAGLFLFTHFVPPHSVAAFIAFFLILSVALISTFAPIAYVIGLRFFSRHVYRATIRHALRQGALVAFVVVLNLLFRTLHSWNIFTALVVCLAAIVIEVLSLAGK
jgi:hypothetical protein